MTVAESIASATSDLPPDKQQEVLDFVEFLKQRNAAAPAQAPSKEAVRKALAAAAGIWQNRTDLPEDSVQTADLLRQRAMQFSTC
jgi:hypothetical protein